MMRAPICKPHGSAAALLRTAEQGFLPLLSANGNRLVQEAARVC
jgi:hypothetical protein